MPESYVLGLLVDYLSPALYLTEILVALLLILSLRKFNRLIPFPAGIRLGELQPSEARTAQGSRLPAEALAKAGAQRKVLTGPPRTLFFLSLLFWLSLLPSVWRGSTALAIISLWRWGELALWLGFGVWVARFISWKKHARVVLFLGLGVAWVSLLALAQFAVQHSILGYWFLGEPELSPSLGGVALGSWGGREVMRAYGTFPHPNVLGGILSVLLVWLAARKRWLAFGTGLGAVVVSLSKTAWVSLLGGLSFFFARLGLGVILPWSDFSVTRRLELLGSAAAMVGSSPLTGIGLGQFTRALPSFGVPSGLSLFIQPVHNVFALIAAESGLFALLAFLALLFFALRQTFRERRWLLSISLLQIIFLGTFDHYFYTLPQGLFLFSLILGLSFSYADS
ncbi:MAG: hypothetical protein Q8L46_00030 [candidate division WWE3 bacterium]|nr:hypothetical protein [candidate division WWE3 bacterium]